MSGKSLAQIAPAKGKSVDGLVAAMVAPAKARVAKAVDERQADEAARGRDDRPAHRAREESSSSA